MNWRGCGRKPSASKLWNCPEIFLQEEMRKNTKISIRIDCLLAEI
jgi:hypothetical protein